MTLTLASQQKEIDELKKKLSTLTSMTEKSNQELTQTTTTTKKNLGMLEKETADDVDFETALSMISLRI